MTNLFNQNEKHEYLEGEARRRVYKIVLIDIRTYKQTNSFIFFFVV